MASRSGTSAHPVPSAGSSEPESHVPLRVSVARGLLGLELYEPVQVGPFEVSSLAVSFPSLEFPVDLTGGVRNFRHRRGRLEHASIGTSLEELGRWASARLGEMLGGLVRPVSVWTSDDGLSFGLVGEKEALAFDLLWAPTEGDARWVLSRERGAGLGAPALAVALHAVDTMRGKWGQRRGRVVRFPNAGLEIARAVLPAVGARAPARGAARFSVLEVAGDRVELELDSSLAPPALSSTTLLALEGAQLTAGADDELSLGHLDEARRRYVDALERAPRKAELARLAAEIDLTVASRAEAALSLLSEILPSVQFGPVGAELLARTGDLEAARYALEAATRAEAYGPVAALLWCRLGDLAESPAEGLRAYDEAVARSPGLGAPRWARFRARLEAGDVGGALADAEHLEAAASGSRSKHEVCRAAAEGVRDAGFVRQAGRLFERALRYLPDDAAATAGLGRSLLELGRVDRGTALLVRAIELGEARGVSQPEALLALAKVLADAHGDLPGAVARVRQITATSHLQLEARALEARWRERLGDVAGASLAYGRLRDAASVGAVADRAQAARWLLEAARFEHDVTKDLRAAEQHLTAALSLDPKSAEVSKRYRELAARLAASRRDTSSDR